MGTWSAGNFDNDSAMDLVADMAREMAKEMAPPTEVEDINLVMAAVEIRKVLVEHCHAPPPKRQEIESLRNATLELFDGEYESLDPASGFAEERRKVIDDTFAAFLQLLHE